MQISTKSLTSLFRVKWISTFICLLMFFSIQTFGQVNYNRTVLSGQTYTPLSGGGITTVNTVAGLTAGVMSVTQDDGAVIVTLPFAWTYNGNTFTTATFCTNGWVGAGSQAAVTAANSRAGGNLFNTTEPFNVLAPWFKDMGANFPTGTGSMRYGLIGTDIYAFQWNNAIGSGFTDGSVITISFQVNIYGPASTNPGRIEFIYGPTAGTITTSAAIGLKNATGGTGNFLNALDGTSTSTTTSSAWPGNGNGYRFDPLPNCVAPINQSGAISFGTVNFSSITATFPAAASTPSGYLVVRYPAGSGVTNPVDGTSYIAGQSLGLGTVVSSLATTGFTASGLTAPTNYDFYVYTFNNTICQGGPKYNTGSPTTATQATPTGTLSGTKTVGTGGDYANLTNAFAAINTSGLSGNIDLQLITGYPASPETYPIVGPTTGPAGGFNIKVYPTVSGLSITSANTTGTLNLNNSSKLSFDGRVNQAGLKDLVISNTNAGTSYAIQYAGDAIGNTIKFCTVTSRNTSTTSGTIVFGTGTTTGNDNNTIDNCDVLDGTSNPVNAIYSLGTSATIDNSGNIVSNSNIANYFSAASATNGILLSSTGNSGWTINNNRFYQTTTRTYTTGNTHTAITVSSGAGYTISGNIIGYANSAGTGTTNLIGNTLTLAGFPSSYAATGTANATRYIGINCAFTAGGAVSSIQNNTVNGFALYTSSTASTANGIWCGIAVTAGNANIGTTTGNIIGATTGTGSVYAATTAAAGAMVGIYATSTNTVAIQNNSIGAFDQSGTTATTTGSITGINTAGSAGIFNISGNTIGNSTNPNFRIGFLTTGGSLSNAATTFAAGSGASLFTGILNAATGAVTIGTVALPNIIRNASVNSTSSSATFRGIQTGSGTPTITANNISNITSASANASVSSGALAGIGIYLSSGTTPVIKQNIISNLSLSNTGTGGYNLAGISYTAPTTSISITRNLIYGLSNASTSTTVSTPGTAAGIFVRDGNAATTDISNNMIRLGNGMVDNTSFIGMWLQYSSSSTTTMKIYHNSIDLEGTVTTGAQPSFGLYRGDFSTSAVTVYTIDAKNNILSNNRTGGTGKHYAIANHYGVTTASATGWVANASNYNILYGNAATIGYWTGDQTFASWKTASASDASSINANPLFVGPTSTPPDLHLTTGSPAESAGTATATVTDDFDGETRSGLSPVDIGADAGAYALVGTDVGVTGVVNPTATTCHSAAENVIITLKNFSANTIDFSVTPVTLTVNVTNAITAGPLTVTLNGSSVPSTLAAGASANFTVGQINTTANGTYVIASSATAAGDVNAANNNNTSNVAINYTALSVAAAAGTPAVCTSGTSTLTATPAGGTSPYTYLWTNAATTAATSTGTISSTTTYSVTVTDACLITATNSVTVTVNNPSIVSTLNGTRCGTGTVSLSAAGSAGTTLNWYSAATGGTLLGTGSPFTTPVISSTTNYYVEANVGAPTATLGPLNPYFGGTVSTVSSPSNSYYMILNAASTATISSVTVYATAAGTLNLQLANSSGTVLQSYSYTITAGQANSTVSAPGTAIVVPVNFSVPVGTSLRLGIATGTTATLLRNTSGSTSYYNVAGNGITFTNNWLPDITYWYFFYNVNIGNGCASARSTVIANVTPAPVVNITPVSAAICAGGSTTLTASSTNDPNYSYSWLPVAGLTPSTGATVLAGPSSTTTYTVTASDAGTGCSASATVAINVTTPPLVTAVASSASVCSGNPLTLTAYVNPTAAPTYTTPPAVTNATTDEDLGAVTIKQGTTTILSNATAINSLAGTIGTATGTAGSYSNFTAFGPYGFTAGQNYTFTLTTVDQAGGYSSAMAIYIDYNRNGSFADAGEQVYAATATTSGVHSETGSFTVPAAAINGLTRMRVFVNEGSITSPTQTIAYGEYEEYMLNISGGTNPSGVTFDWSNGTSSVGTTSPLVVNPTSNTSYTVAATYNGCTVTSNTVSVTTTPAPNAPGGNNSIQCGTAVPNAFVTSNQGSPNGNNMRWYNAQTNGTLVQTGGFNYTSTVSTTTTFWVSETNGTCESARTPVTVNVNPPDGLSAASNGPVCGNSALLLTATVTSGTNGNIYNYVWTANPASGSGIPTSQGGGSGTFGTPSSTTITPTTGGTYTYTVTGTDPTLGCVAVATVVVTIKANPVISSTTATPSTPVCAGVPVSLQSKSGTGGPGSVTLGAGANTTTLSTDGTPYRTGNSVGNQFKNQYLFLASELQAAGLGAGNITSVQLTVTGSGGGTLSNFAIKLGTTAQTALTTTYVTGLTTVLSLATYPATGVLTTGVQTHTLTTPFAWNGTSNIVLEMCAQLATSGNAGTLAGDTQPFNATILNNAITTDCGSITGSGVSTVRPKVTFGGFIGVDLTSSYNWTYNPGSLNGSTVTVAPLTTTTYTVTAVNPATSCSSTANITVTVNPLPPVPSGTDGSGQCGTALSDMNVSSNNSIDPQSPPFFKWYDAATGGTVKQSGTSTTYTTPVSATIDLWVSEVSANGCEGPRVHVHTDVSDADPITVNTTATTVCPGSSFNISASYTSSFNSFATFDLTATGGSASGITGSVSLTPNGTGDGSDPYAVSPTAAGTYTYTITAFDPDKGCTAVNTVVVTVTAAPTISSATATPATVCAGTTVTLNARNINGATGSVTLGAAANTTTLSTDGTPYRVGNTVGNQFKNQYLFLASELQAGGLLAGNINSVQLTVAGSGGGTLSNFAIKLGTTAQTALTTTYVTGLTTVLSLATYPATGTLTTGVQTHVLTTPFAWNGTSNIVLEMCAQLATSGTAGTLAGDTQPFNATILNNAITTDCGSTTGSGVSTVRPKVTFGGLVGTDLTSTYNWVWNPGNINSGTTGTATVNPSSTTTYTVTATSAATGCSNTATVTVTVNPIPAAPTTNSPVTRCGPGSVTLTAGGSGGTYKWYSVSTGGTSLFTGASYTPTVPAGSSTYYVDETSAAGCTGPRAAVTVNTGTAPTLVITPSGPTGFCQSGSVVLNAASGSSSTYTNFNWTASPATGSGLSSNSGAIVTAAPTVAGSYTYTVTADDGLTNGCANIATIIVTSNANPIISSVTATPAAICAGGNVTLEAKSNIGAPLSIKAGTGTGGFTGAANPYWNSNSADGSKFQFLYKASDLLGLGLTAGPINALTFKVTTATIPAAAFFDNFSISMGQTSATVMTGTWQPGMQVVKNPFYHVPVTGNNTYNFDNAFVWDGTSNIVIQVCYDNDPHNTCTCTGNTLAVEYTVASYVSSAYYYETNSSNANRDMCGSTATATTQSNLPNVTFVRGFTNNTSLYNWQWNPGAIAGAIATVNPTSTTSYTVTATDPSSGCQTVSSPVTVSIVQVTANATASPSTPVCAGTAVTLNSGGTGGGTLSYAWASTPAGTYPATSGISVSPTVTTVYTVTVTDNCSNSSTSTVTVNVNPAPTATIQETSPVNVCDPGTQVLHAQTNAASPSYQWTLNGANITGATSSTYTVSGVGSGTYRVIITNTATNCVSAASAGVVVTINAQPSAVTVTPATATLCNGGSVNLSATGGTIANPNAVALSENFDNAAPGWTFTNDPSSPTVSNWYYQAAPYTDASGTATFSNFTTLNGGKFAYSNSDAGGSGSVTNTILTSPVFSLANYTAASLTFEHAYRYWATGDTKVAVEISTDGGTSWTTLQSYLGTSVGSTTNLSQTTANATIILTPYLNQSNLRLRYNFVSTWGYYWIIDNVKVSGSQVVNTSVSWLPATGLNTTSGANVIASPTTTTTYTATSTSALGCTNSNTSVVTVNPRPTGIITGDANYCAGQGSTTTILSIAVTGTGPWNGTLSPGAVPFSGSSSPITVTVTPSSTTTYTIATLSGSQCNSIAADLTGSATVTVNPVPATPTVSPATPTAQCGGTITLTSSSATGNQWNLGGSPIGGATNQTLVVSASGNYSVTVSNGFNCSVTSAVTAVTINPVAATPTITPAGPVTQCGGTVTLTSSSPTGNQWNLEGSPIGGATSQTLVASASGNYSVTVTNGSGCSVTSVPTSVTINPAPSTPTVTPAGSITQCGGTITFTSSSATGNQWNLNGSPVGGATNQTLVVSASGNYSVTVTNGFNCTATSAAVSVTINPVPATPTITPAGPVTQCGGTVTLTSSSPTGNQWNLEGSPIGGATSQTLVASASGNYSVTVTNGSGCSVTSVPTSVTINPAPSTPTVTPAGSITQCGGTITLTSSSATGNQWNLEGSPIGGATNQTLVVSASGNYSVTVSNGFSCTATSASVSVTINPVPATPTITPAGPVTQCGGTVTLTSSSATGNQWNLEGSPIGGATSQTLVASASGNYSVTITNGSGCSVTSVPTSVTINPAPSTPTVTPAGSITQCGGTITLTSSSATGNQWNLNSSPIGGATNSTLVVSASGNYSVTVSNGFNCTATSAAVSVTINPVPATPTITPAGPVTQCGGTVTLTSSSATGNQWNLNGSPISGATNSTLVVTASGDYTVTVTNGFGCSATSAITTVTVNPLAATPTASVVQPTCAVGTGTINVTSPLGAGNTYSLDGTSFQSSPTFPGKAPGTYTLYVHNTFGCFAPATINVTVNPQPFIPAAPTVTGTINVCPFIAPGGGAPLTYHASSPGATSYTWTIPPSRVYIVSGNGTADLTLKFDTGYANVPNKQIRVTASSVCGTSPTFTIFYTLAQYPGTPNPIAGPTDACPFIGTANTATYTINKATSATGYLWNLPTGATAVHPNGAGTINDTTIIVTYGPGFTASGNITVFATNDCGTSGARNLFITRNAPAQPGLITGPTNACEFSAPNGTPATYSVLNSPGVTYTWTVPAGSANLTGQGTSTISFVYPNGFTSGTVSVTASSGCGASVVRTLSISRLNAAIPSVIDVIQTHFCGEAGGRVFTYTISAMPANATSVQWTVPTTAGAILVNGQGSTSITVRYPDAAVAGTVTAQGVNNCGASTIRSTSVHLPACPPPGFAGTNSSNTNNTAETKGTDKSTTILAVESMEVKIFPNPIVSDFKLQVITSQKEEINVRVIDNEGRLFKTFKVMPYQTIALGAELKPGSYMVEVRQGKTVKTTKVIKF